MSLTCPYYQDDDSVLGLKTGIQEWYEDGELVNSDPQNWDWLVDAQDWDYYDDDGNPIPILPRRFVRSNDGRCYITLIRTYLTTAKKTFVAGFDNNQKDRSVK